MTGCCNVKDTEGKQKHKLRNLQPKRYRVALLWPTVQTCGLCFVDPEQYEAHSRRDSKIKDNKDDQLK